jgi:DNA-directed RNA polymerase specialized sigma24 family protein
MDALETNLGRLARRYANARVPYDDLLQEARIAAWTAMQRADSPGTDA